jgi:hypothetical protein
MSDDLLSRLFVYFSSSAFIFRSLDSSISELTSGFMSLSDNWTEDMRITRPQPAQVNTNIAEMRMYNLVTDVFRTHNPSVPVAEDCRCLKLPGHCNG